MSEPSAKESKGFKNQYRLIYHHFSFFPDKTTEWYDLPKDTENPIVVEAATEHTRFKMIEVIDGYGDIDDLLVKISETGENITYDSSQSVDDYMVEFQNHIANHVMVRGHPNCHPNIDAILWVQKKHKEGHDFDTVEFR